MAKRNKIITTIFVILFFILMGYISYVISNNLLNYIVEKISERISILSITSYEALNAIVFTWLYIYFILLIPILYYLSYRYLKDALYKKERKYYLKLRKLYLLMMLGVGYGYYTAITFMIPFLFTFNEFLGINNTITLSSLIGTIIKNCILFSLIFLTPFLIKITIDSGLIRKNKFKSNRGFIYILMVILSAILTPPDLLSMVVATIPLVILFEIGVFLGKKDNSLEIERLVNIMREARKRESNVEII